MLVKNDVNGRRAYATNITTEKNSMNRLQDTRAPFWTGIGTGSRARQVQDPNRELAFVSGRARRLFPRVRFHFWPQRRRYTCILFLSCELPHSRSRQNRRARQRTDPLRPVNLKLELRGSSLALDLERLSGGFVLVDLLMKGFRKT